MSLFFSNYFESTSIVDVIQLYWNSAILYLTNAFTSIRKTDSGTIKKLLEYLPETIHFDDFQWKLLTIFSCLLLFNIISIIIVWNIYGQVLSETFMKNSTLREIEELKASVAKLKLPKEHSPRI